MDKNQLVASRLREIRKKKNILQRHVAAGLGMTENAYSRIENGPTQITLNYLYKLSEILEEPVTELLDIKAQNIANNNQNLFLSPFNHGNLTISVTPEEFQKLYALYQQQQAAND
jgi:transcriptional regulator with XRE-family HTH domain